MISVGNKIATFARQGRNVPGILPIFQNVATRPKSSFVDHASEQATPSDKYQYPLNEDGDAPPRDPPRDSEVISFPAVDKDSPAYNSELKPVLLNPKEHVVGYLSKILNARVYDAAIETELQHAKNLSAVSQAVFAWSRIHSLVPSTSIS
jgi:hypothetical protein